MFKGHLHRISLGCDRETIKKSRRLPVASRCIRGPLDGDLTPTAGRGSLAENDRLKRNAVGELFKIPIALNR